MKKVLLSLLVVFVSIAIFAVEEEVVEDKLVDISGTVGFDLTIDEAGLELVPYFRPKIVFEKEVAGGTFKATFGPSVTTELYLVDDTKYSTPVTWDYKEGKYVYTDDFGNKTGFDPEDVVAYKVSSSITSYGLTSVTFDADAWSLTAAPKVVGLSTYTIGGFTPAEAALQLNLKDYGLKLELVDSLAYTNEVTPHATGTFELPRFWHLGAMYDFDLSGVAGSVAGAYKFEDATNNRIAIEANLTEVPVPGSLSADLVFGLLNFEDLSGDASSATAYRVNAAYKYPLEMGPVTVTPHVGFTWQNNLETVYEEEHGNDLMALVGVSFGKARWVDKQEVAVGVDVSYTAEPVTVNLEDTLTVDLSGTELAFSVAPHLNVGVDVTEKLALSLDGYYFYDSEVEDPEDVIAYMVDVSYAINDYLKAGVHAGNENWSAYDVEVVGANPLFDIHWNLYLNGELEF